MYTKEKLISILEELLKQPTENEIFELKEAKNDYDFNKLGKYFSALSNEANLQKNECAWLVFGISDNRTTTGTSYRLQEKKLQSLKKEVADKTNNRITFQEIYPISYKEKRIIMFQIPPATRGTPTSFDGFCYDREGDSISPLSQEKRDRIELQNKQADWSAQIVSTADLNDLDPTAIHAAKENYLIKHPAKIDELKEWDDKEFLNKAKITIKGKITNTALLLLGKPESKHYLSPADASIRWILKDSNGV